MNRQPNCRANEADDGKSLYVRLMALKQRPSFIGSRQSNRPALFVWSIWLLLSVVTIWVVIAYGQKIPYDDDWFLAEYVVEQRPITISWLWEQWAEHRIPIPKLLWVYINRLSGFDCRAGCLFNVFVLASLAAAMILAAKRIRGRTIYADAFFSFLMLHWRQSPVNFDFQIQFLASVFFASIALLIITLRGNPMTCGSGLLYGVCLLALPGCGANGLALVPALALWIAMIGALEPEKRKGLFFIGIAVVASWLVIAYFIGLSWADSNHPPLDRTQILSNLSWSLSGDLGAGVKTFTVWTWWIEPVLFLATVALLIGVAWFQSAERRRALGLFCTLGSFFCLAVALSLGRSLNLDNKDHVACFALPAFAAVYFAWTIHGPSRYRQLLLTGLLLFSVAGFLAEVPLHIQYQGDRRREYDAFERDLIRGVTPDELAQHYGDLFTSNLSDEGIQTMASYFRWARDAKIGLFTKLQEKKSP